MSCFSDSTLANSTSSNTPKRKRAPPPPPTPPSSSPPDPIRLTTAIALNKEEESGAGSPRTKVAYTFGGLQIADKAVSKLDLQRSHVSKIGEGKRDVDVDMEASDESMMRKRAKVLEIPETPDVRVSRVSPVPVPKSKTKEASFMTSIPARKADATTTPKKESKIGPHNEMDPVIFKSGSPMGKVKGGGLARAYPSINRLSDSKSRGRKRAGTPPLMSSSSNLDTSDSEEGSRIVDPDRAALTWHDDEITGHDPDDPDDDGEGINGIGFKPTAAEAYARAQKRKMQMAEYRSREAKEARAKRNERRRASDREEERERHSRVRFLEAEKIGVVSIITD